MIAINTPTEIEYSGAGTIGTFAIPFPVYNYDQIIVTVIEDANQDKTILVPNADYEIPFINVVDASLFLKLVFDSQAYVDSQGNLLTGYTLKIEISTDVYQPANLRNLGSFAPAEIEKALDRSALYTKRVSDTAQEGDADTLQEAKDYTDAQLASLSSAKLITQVITSDVAEAVNSQLYISRSSSPITITLPSTPNVNDLVVFKRRGTGEIIINGGTIDGEPSYTLSDSDESVSIIYDGTEWVIY